MAIMKKLLKCKDELHYLQAERAVYLKASLKMFQRGIVELELQVFLGIHTSRSENNKRFFCGSPPVGHNCDFSSLMRHWRTCPPTYRRLSLWTKGKLKQDSSDPPPKTSRMLWIIYTRRSVLRNTSRQTTPSN